MFSISRFIKRRTRSQTLCLLRDTNCVCRPHLSDTNASEGEKDRSKEDKETAVGSGSNVQWIFALMSFERVDLLLSGKIFRSTLSFLANPLFKYILRLCTDSRPLSLVLFERYYTTERAKEKLRLVILVHLLRVFLPLDSFLATKSGRGV